MRVLDAQFVTGAVRPEQWPETGLPEIAFAGRSNVGKSSLINRILSRKKLVRTSSKPGATREINFFRVRTDRGELMFVDLPGYGYAKTSKAERASWGPMMERYFNEREELEACVTILDIRRMPNEADEMLLDYLFQSAIATIPVLTKADKLSGNERSKQAAAIRRSVSRTVELESPVVFSAVDGRGMDQIWRRIFEYAGLAG